MTHLGLLLNFLGSVIAGFAGFFGLSSGYGGQTVWLHASWGAAWWIGWALLAAGFLLQYLDPVGHGATR